MYQNFTKLRHCHNYTTRNSEYNFWIPPIKGQQKDTFFYNAIKDWNALPNDIKSNKNFNNFKSNVKEYLTGYYSTSPTETFLYY